MTQRWSISRRLVLVLTAGLGLLWLGAAALSTFATMHEINEVLDSALQGAAPRLLALAVAAYALSPIDLIPDFIPILGYLDDLLIVPLGILLVIRLLPAPVLASARAKADALIARPQSRAAAVVVILIWIVGCLALGYWLIAG